MIEALYLIFIKFPYIEKKILDINVLPA